MPEDEIQGEEECNAFETKYFNLGSQVQEILYMKKSFITASNSVRLAALSLPTFLRFYF